MNVVEFLDRLRALPVKWHLNGVGMIRQIPLEENVWPVEYEACPISAMASVSVTNWKGAVVSLGLDDETARHIVAAADLDFKDEEKRDLPLRYALLDACDIRPKRRSRKGKR